jgi:uncharacterized protein
MKGRGGVAGLALVLACIVSLTGCSRTLQTMAGECADARWPSPPPPASSAAPTYRGIEYTSRYLTMRDGTRIAIDLYLPKSRKPGELLPALVRMTPYGRSYRLQPPFSLLRGTRPFAPRPLWQEARYFVRHGYAWVEVDVRGTGASTGTRPYPLAPAELRDGAEIVDWIIGQPWSNGKVGAVGSSYSGLAAGFLLVNRHPAVRAVAPCFSAFDLFEDQVMPGGIPLAWFTDTWGRLSEAMDNNKPAEFFGWEVKLYVRGINPVCGDRGGQMLAQAVREHQDNFDIRQYAPRLTFRDDGMPFHPGVTLDAMSPHAFVEDARQSGAAIYSYSGWFDGACANSAIKRYLQVNNPGSRLILGPWAHGGYRNQSPCGPSSRSCFDHHGELLRFFDSHLRDPAPETDSSPPIHYYTMGEEKWKAAYTWPPAGWEWMTWYFDRDRLLSQQEPRNPAGEDSYQVDLTTGTGPCARWKILMGLKPYVMYPDRELADAGLLSYTSPPLGQDLEVTGHPVARLYVRSTAADGNFFLYLEDVDENGHVAYVTEGELRALHRKVSADSSPAGIPVPQRTFRREQSLPLAPGETAELAFELLPVSYLFKEGHRVRVALAGADKDYFTPLPMEPPTVTFGRNSRSASRISLPVVPRP